MASPSPAPVRQRVKVYLTPLIGDLLFYEHVNCDTKEHPEYGTPHPNTTEWPSHRLVFIAPSPDAERANFFRYYYAADRDNEDTYNWDIGQGEQVIRSYLVERSKYYGRSVAEAAAASPLVADEFTHPAVATADPRFPKYGFADDTVVEAPEELRSVYIVVRRRYIEPVVIDYRWSEQLERQIKITKTIITAGSQQPPPASIPGNTNEVQNGNVFHDVLINQQIVLEGEETYPLALSSLPSTYNRRFPARLDSVDLVYAWARAYQTSGPTAPESYSEDFYFKFKITEPRPGPYEATALRFITNNPDALKATYPITLVPSPITESIGICGAWAYASPDGNRTMAVAKEWSVPETIHPLVTLTIGGEPTPLSTSKYITTTLAATPGYATFITALASPLVVDYNVRDAPLGLYDVTVLRISVSGLYTP